MGMSTHVVGFKPADEKYKKMLAVRDACDAAGVAYPESVRAYFGDDYEAGLAEAHGICVNMDRAAGVTEWSDKANAREGYEVDLRQIDPDVKILRFYNSW